MHESALLDSASAAEVHDLLLRCADYFDLQDGELPNLQDADDLFTSAPTGCTSADKLICGLRQDQNLVGLAELLLGYPRDCDCYLGLLLVEPRSRCRGLGASLLRSVEGLARARGKRRMLAAVLTANEAALRFWSNNGFEIQRAVAPARFKARTHSRLELAKAIDA